MLKIQFDPSQQYQRDAIDAVIELFKGQPHSQEMIDISTKGQQSLEGSTGTANQLLLSDEAILENLHYIQKKNKLSTTAEEISELTGFDFSIEMETGTGKTYVYLRTILELYLNYGFSKFIIVVPSVAIREGVLKSIDLMREHFKTLYDNLPFESYIYDSKKLTRLRQFARSNELQIMVMNIDAFNKTSNVINRPNEDMGGEEPITFIRKTHPILILDEPQNMENEKSKVALANLNPLLKLRYSATHRNPYHLLYNLNPAKAYQLKLVKRIGVTSIVTEDDFNQPYIEFHDTKATKRTVSAQLTIDELQSDGSVKRKKKWLRSGDDLYDKSNGRHLYQGYIIDQIHHGEKWIRFSNNVNLEKGFSHGVDRDLMMRVQLEEMIRAHFEKELEVKRMPIGKRLKVLSLIFIDKVANYADEDGKIHLWFNELYESIRKEERYQSLSLPSVEGVQGSYFSQDNKNKPKDTSGKTKQDDESYNKIMRDKEQLLSLEEPIRFIFSHSALREGWDNPNVFQICTLNETFSEVKKRQEIGRGLRLPVDESGERCTDMKVNRLTVVANEHYDDFAEALQTEMTEDGYEFSKSQIDNNRERKPIKLLSKWRENTDFIELWDRIKHQTKYSVSFDTNKLIRQSVQRLQQIRLQPPKIKVRNVDINVSKEGISGEALLESTRSSKPLSLSIPNIVEAIQRTTQLKRSTVIDILQQADNYDQLLLNPQRYIEEASNHIQSEMTQMMVDGIKYEKIADGYYEMHRFEMDELNSYVSRMVSSSKSIYTATEVDSTVERSFAEQLERMDDINFYLKLPSWFTIKTPLGKYNPDWAIVKEEQGQSKLYFVAETKGSTDEEDLRGKEIQKIECGKAHFETLSDVSYKIVTDAEALYL
ncbi:type III restriction enzyme [Halobacillus dabanensis]|uniref:Type III restriction enzyme n=1 Tax=Halobacillus dabanensis TaxID=240302 RepID=A0A1I3ZY35_HALDA|nr:DEAD/DEAH box helicase family protein [Halobacillus dabanensis]SFK48963.1 type III restriction enzyme [Halobacillus dabanensis]